MLSYVIFSSKRNADQLLLKALFEYANLSLPSVQFVDISDVIDHTFPKEKVISRALCGYLAPSFASNDKVRGLKTNFAPHEAIGLRIVCQELHRRLHQERTI